MKRILASGRLASNTNTLGYSTTQHERKGHLLQLLGYFYGFLAGSTMGHIKRDHISTVHIIYPHHIKFGRQTLKALTEGLFPI